MTADLITAAREAREALLYFDIGRCDPDTMRSIAAYVAKLETENARLGYRAVRRLEWGEPCPSSNMCWTAKTAIGTYYVANDGGYWGAGLEDNLRWEWEPEDDPRSFRGPESAQSACQEHFASVIRSGLDDQPPPATTDTLYGVQAGIDHALSPDDETLERAAWAFMEARGNFADAKSAMRAALSVLKEECSYAD